MIGPRGEHDRFRRFAQSLAAVLAIGLVGGPASAEKVTTSDGVEHDWTVLSVTDAGIVVKTADGSKSLGWGDLEARSACALRKRLVKEDDAAGCMALARFCLARKLADEARRAAIEAKRLDPKLTVEADRLIGEANGERVRRDPAAERLTAILGEQRGRAEQVGKVVGEPVTMLETDHFIIYTTFPKGDHKLFKKVCEKLYKGFDRVFDISKNEDRMWDGKAVVYLFKDREEFVVFSNTVHKYPGQTAGGYFRAQGGHCEIVIPRNGDLDDFMETLVHEGAHAFLHFYRDLGHIPLWVHEGVAQYFQFQEFPRARMARSTRRTVKNGLRRGRPLSLVDLAKEDRPRSATDFEGYAYAHAYVSFLVKTSRKKFAEFIRLLKSGEDPEEALEEAYGWDMKAAQEKWAKSMLEAPGEP